MTDRLALPRRYRDQLEALLREHVPGVDVWAYGSRVNGESHDGSDLDLVLRSTTLAPLGYEYFELVEALEQSNIPILVQVHDWARLPESFHREIEREYVVVERVASEPMGTMEDGWAEIPFSEAVEINPSVPLDRGVVYTFVDMASVNAETRSVKSVQEREFQGGGSRFQDGDTLMARITPCLENGKIARYQSSGTQKDAHGSTEFIVIRGRPDLTDNDFAYYLTQWKEVRNYAIGQMTGTSGRQRVPMDSLDHLTVPLPPVSEQRAIAHILGTLDDKIELNRRMNQTLEEMARAIFQGWFVDFGPVRAKLEGREPYLPPELWDLFPDRLVESELGEIPEGWEVKALDSIVTFLNGLALQKYPATDGSALPVIKIAQLRVGHTIGADSASSHLPPQYVVYDGDVLFSWSGSLELDIWAGGEGALNQHLFKVTSREYPKWLYCRWVREHLPGFREIAAGKTTTMGHIQRHHLSEALTVIPDAWMLKAMDHYMSPLVDRSLAFRIESRKLATQRDALLPGLVSGEVVVRDDVNQGS